ncbi:hypothetical protein Golob_011732 [Gossypium lobatum]|uniref:RNase H type-1 domain-containing protein n=1 Tax=Gossypium lobatum TaxID=34289 RepID=A0A7J8MQF8_9ROSI|nr:hypothetical protein [Gossypium lobatum]
MICALWLIWNARNERVHKNVIVQIQDVVCRVQAYLLDFDAVHVKLPGRLIGTERWWPPKGFCLKVNFDATFNAPMPSSSTGIVIRNNMGFVIGSTLVGNTVAHLLASKGLRGGGQVYQRGIPDFSELMVERDRHASRIGAPTASLRFPDV